MKHHGKFNRVLLVAAIAVLLAPVAFGGRALFSPRGAAAWLTPFAGGAADRLFNPRIESIFDAFNAVATAVAPQRIAVGRESFKQPRLARWRSASLAEVTASAYGREPLPDSALQHYLDAALGDPVALSARVRAVLMAIEADARRVSPVREYMAVQRLRQAAAGAIGTAYLTPLDLEANFKPLKSYMGWDVGQKAVTPGVPGFGRIGLDSASAVGPDRYPVQHPGQPLFQTDSLAGLSRLVLKVPDGEYRLLLTSADKIGRRNIAYPFGASLRVNGSLKRIVDSRGSGPGPRIAFFNGAAASTDGAFSDVRGGAIRRGGGLKPSGVVLSVPARIRGGLAVIDFAPPPGTATLVSAVLMGQANYARLFTPIDQVLARLKASGLLALGPSGLKGADFNALAPGAGGDGEWVWLNAVTKERALAGAIAKTPQGSNDLQAYFDQSGGDLGRLRDRALGLIEALATSAVSGDFLAMAETANLITDATLRSAKSAIVMPYSASSAVSIPKQTIALDFGPTSRPQFSGFRRVGPTASIITGRNVHVAARVEAKPGISSDVLEGVERLQVPVPNGAYRVFVVGPTRQADSTQDWLGAVTINGQPTRSVDIRQSSPVTWMKWGSEELLAKGGLEAINAGLQTEELRRRAAAREQLQVRVNRGDVLQKDQDSGALFAVRAFVTKGQLTIGFQGANGRPTQISALIITPDSYESLEQILQNQIAALLGETSPAAGGNTSSLLADGQRALLIGNRLALAPRGSRGAGGGSGANGAPARGAAGGGSATTSGSGDSGSGGTSGGGTSGGGTSGGGTSGGGTSGGGTSGGGTSGGGTSGGGTSGDGGTSGGGTSGGGTSGGGTSGGGTSGGGTSGGGTSGGGTSGGGTSGGGTSGGGTSGGGTSGDGGTSGGGTSGGGTSGGGTSGGGTSGDGGTSGGGTSGGGTSGGGTSGGGTSGGGTSGGGTSGGGTSGGGTSGGGTSGGGTSGGGTSGGGTSGGGTSGGGTSGGGTSGGGTSGDGGTSGGGTSGGGGPTITLHADAGLDLQIELGDSFVLNGLGSSWSGFDPALISVEWLLDGATLLADGYGVSGLTASLKSGVGAFNTAGVYHILLRLTYGSLTSLDNVELLIRPRQGDIPEPDAILLFMTGMGAVLLVRRRKK